jgi:transcriptional regulator with XRE-family HTH domain
MNMTQEELAEKLLSTRTTVSNYETGRSSPDIDMLVTISEVFETSPEALIFGIEDDCRKTEKGKRYFICLSAVLLAWILMSALVRHSMFSDRGFPMYWVNAYEALLKPAFVFVTAFFAALVTAQFRPAKKNWKFSRLTAWLIGAAAAVWTVLAVIAFAGLTRYYAGASPAALNGMEWTGWTCTLFAVFSKNYGNTAYLIWHLAAGFLQGRCFAYVLSEK